MSLNLKYQIGSMLISTVELSYRASFRDPLYESCVFNLETNDSDVVARYMSYDEAVDGHRHVIDLCRRYVTEKIVGKYVQPTTPYLLKA